MKIGGRHTHKVGEKSRTPGDNDISRLSSSSPFPSIYEECRRKKYPDHTILPSPSSALLEYFLRSKSSPYTQRCGNSSHKEVQKCKCKTQRIFFTYINIKKKERNIEFRTTKITFVSTNSISYSNRQIYSISDLLTASRICKAWTIIAYC